jgi:hypothetical protein
MQVTQEPPLNLAASWSNVLPGHPIEHALAVRPRLLGVGQDAYTTLLKTLRVGHAASGKTQCVRGGGSVSESIDIAQGSSYT